MRRRRKTKILATLGPASNTRPMMRALFDAGVDVFRINMSHPSHDMLKQMVGELRSLSEEVGRPIGVLCDLQGPKIRLGKLTGGPRMLKEGERIKLILGETSETPEEVPIPHPEIFQAIKQKHALLIDDGKVRLRLLRKADTFAEAIVEVAGEIKDRKGVNMPDTLLPMSAMTPKDRADLDAALELGVDWIALSFVQRPEDVAELKKIVAGRAGVLAKIEKPKALDSLHGILELADALMVARGDLGVEMPLERVPGLQKQITHAARKAGKPVVVATQMLESMITSPMPTRAEVSDVATAVFDGADAVMLSAETAAGQYPVEAVAIMSRIISRIEQDDGWRTTKAALRPDAEKSSADAIAAAARQVADTIEAKAICAFTSTGATVLRIARERPDTPIMGLTSTIQTARKLALVWGVEPVEIGETTSMTETVARATQVARREGFAERGDEIIVVAGVPFGRAGATNSLRVAKVGRDTA